MALPPRTREDLIAAMRQFDAELRETPEWQDWMDNNAHKYAISFEGQRYPVKQIITMATGTPRQQFNGGDQSNRYVRALGFEVEMLRFPEESYIKSALHDLLLETHPDHLLPKDAYRILGDRFEVPEDLRQKVMDDGQTIHWQNRIQWARQKLVSDGLLDNSVRGEWFLKTRDHPVVWVEKTLVSGRPDREEGAHALGRALWSPLRSKSDGDIYKLMRQVQPEDVVLHLTDNKEIKGVSIVSNWADSTFKGVEGTDWADAPSYRIPLHDYTSLNPPLGREQFLGDEEFKVPLLAVLRQPSSQFFNTNLELNQGAYLTQASDELLDILNAAYLKHAGKELPMLPQRKLSLNIEISLAKLRGAKRLFTWIYGEDGFESERYINEERSYKESFKNEWQQLVNKEALETALTSGETIDYATEIGRFLSDSQRSNLLPFWYNGVLRAEFDETRATEFLLAIQNLLFSGESDAPDINAFNEALMPQYEANMNEGRIKPASHCIPSLMLWLTYPDTHFYIRPELVNDVARCLSGSVLEGQGNVMSTAYYSRVLALVQRIRVEITDMHPRDMIDVQGFLWGAFSRKKIWFGGKSYGGTDDKLPDFLSRSIYAIGFENRQDILDRIEDIKASKGADREQKKTALADLIGENTAAKKAVLAFAELVSEPGAILLAKSTYNDRGDNISKVKISGACQIGNELTLSEDLGNQVAVEWLSQPNQILEAGRFYPKVNATLQFLPLAETLELLAQDVKPREDTATVPVPTVERYTIEDCARETGYSASQIRIWINRLKRKQQIIFQGPPGTGKTFLAERFARIMVSETDGNWDVVQFHPSYSYEDFMQGIRPRVTEQGHLTYELEDGRFLEFCQNAASVSAETPCVLIIDEINRANLSRVFGELMYLLEYRDQEIPLSTGGNKFKIPPNVYIVGTMNTADRSIALVDHALRRRFSFIYLEPALNILEKHLHEHSLPLSLVVALRTVNSAINDRHHEVGISYFMKDGEALSTELPEIWQGEIEPYLEEYFYDRPQQAEELAWTQLSQNLLSDWL